MLRKLLRGRGTVVCLTLGVRARQQVLEVSHAHGKVIGGAHPHHLVDIEGHTKTDVQEILDGNSKAHGKITVASKIKVTAMLFQNLPAGIPTIEVVAARPQTNNEST